MNPKDHIDDLDSCLDAPESDYDFKLRGDHERAEPPRKTLHRSVLGIPFAMARLAERNPKSTKAKLQRQVLKLGAQCLVKLSECDDVMRAYKDRAKAAQAGRDRGSIAFLERRAEAFSFPHIENRKLSVSIYPWVAKKCEEVADATGLPLYEIVLVCMMLGLSQSEEWEHLFVEDIGEFFSYLKRREFLLKSDL